MSTRKQIIAALSVVAAILYGLTLHIEYVEHQTGSNPCIERPGDCQ